MIRHETYRHTRGEHLAVPLHPHRGFGDARRCRYHSSRRAAHAYSVNGHPQRDLQCQGLRSRLITHPRCPWDGHESRNCDDGRSDGGDKQHDDGGGDDNNDTTTTKIDVTRQLGKGCMNVALGHTPTSLHHLNRMSLTRLETMTINAWPRAPEFVLE